LKVQGFNGLKVQGSKFRFGLLTLAKLCLLEPLNVGTLELLNHHTTEFISFVPLNIKRFNQQQ